MAAAYAALLSLMHTIQHLQDHHSSPISLDKSQVESLIENITFFLDFIEGSQDSDSVQSCITDAARAAEDIIESHIVDHILDEARTIVDLYKGLQGSIEYMDFIKKEVKQIKEKAALSQNHLHGHSTTWLRSSFTAQNTMVGFDDELVEIMDKLTGQQSDRKTILIVGMGGIGKTTLAKNVYSNSLIQHHFDVCAWATTSLEHSTPEILKEMLNQVNEEGGGDESELGVTLHKHLTRRRYLIVMDDMWSIEVWDKINLFLPDNDNGSRIIVTTRQSNLASQVTDFYQLHMKFLDVDKSWDLFCKLVFGEGGCPLELEEIGRKIARGCRGLPLSISVIGGLLAKSNCDREYWEYIAQNLNSVVNLDESCLNILHMSYSHLPAYLKPCFLFVGVFPEDHRIRVSMLIELWVAEGLVKPNSGKSLEEVAGENFKCLVDRNLVLVDELGSTGNIKYCKIHDLLRGFCLRQAQKEVFYNVIEQQRLSVPQESSTFRRIVVPEWPLSPEKEFRYALQSVPLSRSFFCHSCESPLPLLKFQLLRVWKTFDWRKYSTALDNMFDLVNMRYFDIRANGYSYFYSFHRLWNLHTLIVDHTGIIRAPSEIWKMPQLRRVQFNALELPIGYMGYLGEDSFVLKNLHTLSTITNISRIEEIDKSIPNIKKLRIRYSIWHEEMPCSFISHFEILQKLESLHVTFPYTLLGVIRLQTFPQSLKKLIIECFDSKDNFFPMIGSLPSLEKLKLYKGSFHENKWETVEGQFCSLKFLHVGECIDLEHWITDSTHFPRLERLVLYTLLALKEIPSEIGEIPTLESIHLKFCSGSVVDSAKRILDEQKEVGNEGLQLRLLRGEDNIR